MPMKNAAALLAPLRARFERRRPIRAGSLIVTLYGDAIAPRGGSLWLGSLNALVAPFGIEPGLVRTAMSRLVAEGWFERNRVGKSSYYRLSATGAAEFSAAADRIYRASDPPWEGDLSVALLTAGDAKARLQDRDRLATDGFGQLSSNVMIRPRLRGGPSDKPADASGNIVLLTATADAGPQAIRQLAADAWDLETLARAYSSFLADVAGLARASAAVERLADDEAFLLRILLVHEWRRIVLRDPLLPSELLPKGWPGAAARGAFRAIYHAAAKGCERWLDATAVDERGVLPCPDKSASSRFK
jgi:phenylacetic acid degradation operon negative regulatory protein